MKKDEFIAAYTAFEQWLTDYKRSIVPPKRFKEDGTAMPVSEWETKIYEAKLEAALEVKDKFNDLFLPTSKWFEEGTTMDEFRQGYREGKIPEKAVRVVSDMPAIDANELRENLRKEIGINVVNPNPEIVGDGLRTMILEQPIYPMGNEGIAYAHRCPKCGKCHYAIENSYVTCVNVATIVKDGKITDYPNPNESTTTLRCLECGHVWEVKG